MLRPVRARSLRLLALAMLAALPARADALVTNVDEATDICSANADPCQINQVFQLVDGANLDFGARAVEIVTNGRLEAGIGSFTLKCGRLRLLTGTATAITMKGNTSFGTSAGVASIKVQRRCSDDPGVFCISELDCARVDAGACTIGDGSATIAGRIVGNADDPAIISIDAAGSVDINQQIQANGTALDSDGGVIDIDVGGNLTVNEKLLVSGGGFGTGGDIGLFAHDDVKIFDLLDATGGDSDGGFIEIDAGRDVSISEDVNASATLGEGFGGEIAVTAGRDITVFGGTATNRLTLRTDGNQSSELFGGDGGIQDYFAGRDIHMGPFVAVSLTGAPPDGWGEEITLDSGRDLILEADVDVKARGIFGSGGYVTIFAAGSVAVAASAKLDMTAGDGGGEALIESTGPLTYAGVIDATTAADSFPGFADFFSAIGDITISGDVTVNGQVGDSTDLVTFDGCEVQFISGARIDNLAINGATDVTARDRIVVGTGAVLNAPNGSHSFEYRDAGKPPVVTGTVSPAAQTTLVPNLTPCPVCGNEAVERGESCDDGNTAGADGCSAACQDEGCIAQTPGWPDAFLCDDGKSCTDDACDDATNACTHVESCADAGPCTTDRCGLDGKCLHITHDEVCDDHIDCTTDTCRADGRCNFLRNDLACADAFACTTDTCNVTLGCTYTAVSSKCNDLNPCTTDQCVVGEGCVNPPNTLACDDGVSCTTNDTCSNSECVGVSNCPQGQVCDVDLGTCAAAPTTTVSVTTTTVIDPPTTTLDTPTTTLGTPTTTTVPLPTTTTTEPPVTTTTVEPTTTTIATTTTTPPTTTVPGPECGNDEVEEGEECDTNGEPWAPGQACRECVLLACGDVDDSGSNTASDALFALRAAVGGVECDCVCDVDDSGSISASDALRLLRKAVGIDVGLACSCV